MSEPVISVQDITKRFHLAGSARSLKTAALDIVKRRNRRMFTALEGVSFDVQEGETLGIIGANGAGKSTLLSIIAGTTQPSSGSVQVKGVVSSLLELGAGFHPDLTGRENVYLYGAIMNIPRAIMRQRFDAIVDFAGIEEFIDQPVRFYSSGMYVRLGFAVAVQVDPDILLIDEVLAVGDAEFQKRCIEKMAEFRAMGKSMLIISHDMNTIRTVSDRIILLDHGKVVNMGSPREVVSQYRAASIGERTRDMQREWGTGEVKFTSCQLTDIAGKACDGVGADRVARVRLDYHAERRIETPTVGFAISDAGGRIIFGSNTELDEVDVPYIEGVGSVLIEIDLSVLKGGDYLLSFSLHSRDHRTNYHRLDHALPLHLEPNWEHDGVIKLPTGWKLPPPNT